MLPQQSEDKPKGKDLSPEELEKVRDGGDLAVLIETPGWQVLKKKLEELAYHSWSDPREINSLKDWSYRELNAFYAANNAKELLQFIEDKIAEADYLAKVKSGEIQTRAMRL